VPLPSWEFMKSKTVAELFELSVREESRVLDCYEDKRISNENRQESTQRFARQSKLDVDYIVRNCLLKAIASLVDKESVAIQRKTHRLALLSDLLDKRNTENTGMIISQRIFVSLINDIKDLKIHISFGYASVNKVGLVIVNFPFAKYFVVSLNFYA